MSSLMNQARSRARFAEAAVERARLSVVPRQAQKAARVPFVTLVSLLLVGGVVGLLLFNTSMQQASFTATAMEQRANVLDAREQSLQMQLERLRDPQKVATRAKKLGMVPASAPVFIRLADGKTLGRPVAAAAEDAMQISPRPTVKPLNLRPRPVIVKPARDDAAKPTANRNGNRTDTRRSSTDRRDVPGRKSTHKSDRRNGSQR